MNINPLKDNCSFVAVGYRLGCSKRKFKKIIKKLEKISVTSYRNIEVNDGLVHHLALRHMNTDNRHIHTIGNVKNTLELVIDHGCCVLFLCHTKKALALIKRYKRYIYVSTRDASLVLGRWIDEVASKEKMSSFVQAVVESLNHGTPVICSECSEVNEVDSDADCINCDESRTREFDYQYFQKTFTKGQGKLKRVA